MSVIDFPVDEARKRKCAESCGAKSYERCAEVLANLGVDEDFACGLADSAKFMTLIDSARTVGLILRPETDKVLVIELPYWMPAGLASSKRIRMRVLLSGCKRYPEEGCFTLVDIEAFRGWISCAESES